MTDTTPDPATMALLLRLVGEIHSEICGSDRPGRHLHVAGQEPPAEPEPQLAKVVEFRRRQ